LDGNWEIENEKRSGFSFLKTDELQIKLEEKKSESTASVTLLPTKRETEKTNKETRWFEPT
jgi:hypothetical protein